MAQLGALFSRAEVARLLNIPMWQLANFANERYRYGLAPSVRGTKGRGKKGLYSLFDLYKVAVGYRLSLAYLSPDEIDEAIKTLFPEKRDPMIVAVKERTNREGNERYLVVNLCVLAQKRFHTGLPDSSLSVEPPEWKCQKSSAKHSIVALCSRSVIGERFQRGDSRAFIVLPFDELLHWVDSRILGRDEIFISKE